MIQQNEDICERHGFNLQWLLTPFSNYSGEIVEGNLKKLQKPAKRDTDREVKKWIRRTT